MVFGSYVSGQADAFSDVDVYVLTRKSGRYARESFSVVGHSIDVLIDSLKVAEEFLVQERGYIRRPASLMLAEGKILFERTSDLRRLQRLAKNNLCAKTKSTKSDMLMHAYSLDDFLVDLQRDVERNDHLQFALDLPLFTQNAMEVVLRKHGSYWRTMRQTLEVLSSLDQTFVGMLKKIFSDAPLSRRLSFVKKMRTYLSERYACALPGSWRIT